MSARLTDAQMTVLRALEKLPEGEWTTATKGGFNGYSAGWLACMVGDWTTHPILACGSRVGLSRLTPAGRALISKLKAEGKW